MKWFHDPNVVLALEAPRMGIYRLNANMIGLTLVLHIPAPPSDHIGQMARNKQVKQDGIGNGQWAIG
ncbi:hypothetical protein N7475_009159 [Penicillium sp. IBT 31633x]|nr:hypothetical protein N7475_009159 [Penicillium sp. IBT 31633x]